MNKGGGEKFVAVFCGRSGRSMSGVAGKTRMRKTAYVMLYRRQNIAN